MCDIHTKESGLGPHRKRANNVQKSTQRNYENGWLLTQRETVKGESIWKQMKNFQRPCVTVTQEEWNSSIEKMSKKCDSPHNKIMRTDHQWLKRKS